MSALAIVDEIDALDSGAVFSPCNRWRYILWRRWDPGKPVCTFIGLNPSTADASHDDPTVRRCIRYAMDCGFGSLWMLNLFAFRATDPDDMELRGHDAIGPRNDEYLFHSCRMADLNVAAWGVRGGFLGRDAAVIRNLGEWARLHVLRITKGGHPSHPLYLPRDLRPIPWVKGRSHGL